ncbi:hypothetical protein ONZ43_g575 [Nemania bipapillata]|uniref:Uncharacterized protein n=1 Tax=Nemania bipapillata TaxID=110536 RepID=A0ACC2J859_9PEZI|nr:hypothetical protein ONZ43_g575 [Nemania bipapillata]
MDSVASEIVAPYPPPHFQRSGSPSYTNPSSTCSSGLSPPTEADYYQVRSPPYTFRCVSIFPIRQLEFLSADMPHNGCDENMYRFDLFPLRTCSMSSDESSSSHHLWAEEEVPQYARGLCIETPDIKEEICIPDIKEIQHTPTMGDFEPMNAPESPCLKFEPPEDDEEDNDGEDDEEYSPYNKKSKPVPTKSAHIGNNQKRRSTSQSSSEAKRTKSTAEQSLVVRPGNKPPIQGAKGQHTCPDCGKVSFKDRTGLENHIKKQHTRPFTCIFEFADCHSTFASKNEWKRHCASQHIVLQYWVCQQDACAQVSNKPNSLKRSTGNSRRRAANNNSSNNNNHRHPTACSSSLPNGTIFNRKDLYTQHLRRMHVPAHLKNKVKSKTHVPEWEEQQRIRQDEAIRTRCHLPTHMRCPAANCTVVFQGTNAWDDRMEHVAKHLEKVAAGTEPPLPFGGNEDSTLVDWATSPEIGILRKGERGKWMLQNPLKAMSYPAPPVVVEREEEEEEEEPEEDLDADADAECEDE